MSAALRLHHDASLIMTNVQVMSQFVTSLNRTASEVMRAVYAREPFPTDAVHFVTPGAEFAVWHTTWPQWAYGALLVLRYFSKSENLKNLAQRAYTNADQSMLDNLVVERFREGHGNVELKKHLCLYPSTGLQDLIGACVRFETHVELRTHAYKSNEGLYTVQGNNSADLTLDEVTRAARKLGYALRPWVDRQQGNRGFNNGGPNRYQNGGSPQQGPKFNQNGNSVARTQNPVRRQTPIGEVKCWTCGKTGHYTSDCKTNGPKFAFAPKVVRMNYLQDVSDNENDYAEE